MKGNNESISMREWFKKHGNISFIFGLGSSFSIAYFLQQITNNESIGTIVFWLVVVAFVIWRENGVSGLKGVLSLSATVLKWLLYIAIAIFIISLIAGWVSTLAPTTIIIVLLLLILLK